MAETTHTSCKSREHAKFDDAEPRSSESLFALRQKVRPGVASGTMFGTIKTRLSVLPLFPPSIHFSVADLCVSRGYQAAAYRRRGLHADCGMELMRSEEGGGEGSRILMAANRQHLLPGASLLASFA